VSLALVEKHEEVEEEDGQQEPPAA
jgi:hypothetical protein